MNPRKLKRLIERIDTEAKKRRSIIYTTNKYQSRCGKCKRFAVSSLDKSVCCGATVIHFAQNTESLQTRLDVL